MKKNRRWSREHEFELYLIVTNCNTIAYKIVFTNDLDHMESIKLLADDSPSVGSMTCLFQCLYIKF
jgi:hypothetical protein